MFVVIVAIVCYNGHVCTYQANKRQAGKPGMPGKPASHLKKAYDVHTPRIWRTETKSRSQKLIIMLCSVISNFQKLTEITYYTTKAVCEVRWDGEKAHNYILQKLEQKLQTWQVILRIHYGFLHKTQKHKKHTPTTNISVG